MVLLFIVDNKFPMSVVVNVGEQRAEIAVCQVAVSNNPG